MVLRLVLQDPTTGFKFSINMADVKVVEVFLRNANDWSDWYRALQGRATAAKIWEYIDPSKPDGPVLKEPELPVPDGDNTYDKEAESKLNLYKLRLARFQGK